MANTTSLERLVKKAAGDRGFAYAKWPDFAVTVAVGPAAAARGHDGKTVLGVEWYRPESFGDDDASAGGFFLAPKSGLARVGKQVVVDRVDYAALDAIRAAAKTFADRIDL